jgi:hypothetical protein
MLLIGREGIKENLVDGLDACESFLEYAQAFFREAKPGGAPVVGVGGLAEVALLCEAASDFHTGRILDEELAAEFFFVGAVQETDLDEDAEFSVIGEAEFADDRFVKKIVDSVEAVYEKGRGSGGVEVRGGGEGVAGAEDGVGFGGGGSGCLWGRGG